MKTVTKTKNSNSPLVIATVCGMIGFVFVHGILTNSGDEVIVAMCSILSLIICGTTETETIIIENDITEEKE